MSTVGLWTAENDNYLLVWSNTIELFQNELQMLRHKLNKKVCLSGDCIKTLYKEHSVPSLMLMLGYIKGTL